MLKFFVLFVVFAVPVQSWKNCPCSSPDLCKPVAKQYKKELVVFGGSGDTWKRWNWTSITNVISFAPLDKMQDLYCYAHSRQIRVTTLVSVSSNDFIQLKNPSYRQNVTKNWMNLIQEYNLDGINIDIEGPAYTKDIRQHITDLTKETYTAVKALNQLLIVTWDIPYSPILVGCFSGYCYDYVALSKFTDYMIVMDYDATLDVLVARANSPINLLIESYDLYLKNLSIDPDQLVMAVPWYGYDYACKNFFNESGHDTCVILGGSPAGLSYAKCNQLFSQNIGGLKWDSTAASPYFTLQENNVTHQIWFDNLESLTIKYKLAQSLKLRGIGMFTADNLDYSSTAASVVKQTTEMWNTLTAYVSSLESSLTPNWSKIYNH